MRGYIKTLLSVGSLLLAIWHELVIIVVVEALGFAIWAFASYDSTAGFAVMLNELPRQAYVSAALIFLIVAQFLVLHEIRKQRDALKSVTDYEAALDILGVEFDRGTQILNQELANLLEYDAWTVRWNQWREDVQSFLGRNFGLRERLMFRNSVLVPQHNLGGLNLLHANDRQQVARKLELLREAMLRHCDIVARRRQDLE
jgi:hypothetical protein